MSTQQVDMFFRYTVKAGQQERYQAYLDKVLPVTEAQEPYILEYEIFRTEDGTYLQHERYENEDALHKHMQVTADGQADFAAATELMDLHAVGQLSESYWNTVDSYGIPSTYGYSRFRAIQR
jgi:quinol monooxygenase YgiN